MINWTTTSYLIPLPILILLIGFMSIMVIVSLYYIFFVKEDDFEEIIPDWERDRRKAQEEYKSMLAERLSVKKKNNEIHHISFDDLILD